jgi:ABC transporter, phosphonate, periplasmic substrate-binding protein
MKVFNQNNEKRNLKSKVFLLVLCLIFQIKSQTMSNNSLPTYKVIFLKNLFTDVDINDAVAALKIWVMEIEKTAKPEFTLMPVIIDNIESIKASSLGDVALVCLNSTDFLDYKSKLNLEGAFLPLINGKVFSQYILLSRNNIDDISKLKGSKIGIESKIDYSIANMWLDILLEKNKLPQNKKFFSEVKSYDKESQLVLSVFFGQLDACIVTKNSFDLMVELNPQVGKKIKILNISQNLILTVTAFPRDFKNKEHRQDIIEAAKSLGSFPGGKQLLTLMNSNDVIQYRNEYLDNIIKLVEDYRNIAEKK